MKCALRNESFSCNDNNFAKVVFSTSFLLLFVVLVFLLLYSVARAR